MVILYEFEHEGKLYRFTYDELHETRGSYAYDTPEETKEAEDAELAMLASGDWVAVGMLVDRPCPGPHCVACGGREELDSLWGIVVENTPKALEQFARESGL